jgi:hypothetical protein
MHFATDYITSCAASKFWAEQNWEQPIYLAIDLSQSRAAWSCIIGGNSCASALASAGDFKEKLKVKWP